MELQYHVTNMQFASDEPFAVPIITVCIRPAAAEQWSTATIKVTVNLTRHQVGAGAEACALAAVQAVRALVPESQARLYLAPILAAEALD